MRFLAKLANGMVLTINAESEVVATAKAKGFAAAHGTFLVWLEESSTISVASE